MLTFQNNQREKLEHNPVFFLYTSHVPVRVQLVIEALPISKQQLTTNNQTMKPNPFRCLFTYIAVATFTSACKNKYTTGNISANKLYGTWQLLSGRIIKKEDTIIAFPVAGQQVIKIFNSTHFAWFRHDTTKSAATTFESYGGTYTLSGNNYAEYITYAGKRALEHTVAYFFLQLHGDTLIQSVKEKADGADMYEEKIDIYLRK